jgi:hypothetical protein
MRYIIILILLTVSSFACLCEGDINSAMKDATKIVVKDGIAKTTTELTALNTYLANQVLLNKLKALEIDKETNLLKFKLLQLKEFSQALDNILKK